MQTKFQEVNDISRSYVLSIEAEDEIIASALSILERRVAVARFGQPDFGCPAVVKDFLRLRIGSFESECFGVLWLNGMSELIRVEEIFFGTLTETAVYPREIVKRALKLNAGAAICFHNHPSQQCEPSRADELLTASIKKCLELVDVRLLDHIVVTSISTTSFAERGLI